MLTFPRLNARTACLHASMSVLLAASFATPSFAHATLEVTKAPANSYYKATIRIGHGCEHEPTNTVTVTMPEGFISAKPMPKTGWKVETVKAKFAKSYELHGKKSDHGVTQIRWTGGSLDNNHYDEFVLRGRITDFEAGARISFPIVQTCANGEARWDQIVKEGQDPHDVKSPAPFVTIEAPKHSHSH